MVLEFITSSLKLRNKPYLMFFEAIIITSLSILFALSIFPEKHTSIAVLAFLIIGIIPLFNKIYSYDSYITNYSKPFLKRHKKTILLLFFLFLGVLITLITSHFVLGEEISNKIFYAQTEELEKIDVVRLNITGDFIFENTNQEKFREIFMLIFKNNLLVLLSAIILSFFYGAGGLFLIVWNASLLALVLINYISTLVIGTGAYASVLGVKHGFLGFLGYVPHGFFEVLAYFIGGLAGAILAKDLFKGIFETPFKWHATRDLFFLIVIAIVCVIIGALIEASYFI